MVLSMPASVGHCNRQPELPMSFTLTHQQKHFLNMVSHGTYPRYLGGLVGRSSRALYSQTITTDDLIRNSKILPHPFVVWGLQCGQSGFQQPFTMPHMEHIWIILRVQVQLTDAFPTMSMISNRPVHIWLSFSTSGPGCQLFSILTHFWQVRAPETSLRPWSSRAIMCCCAASMHAFVLLSIFTTRPA